MDNREKHASSLDCWAVLLFMAGAIFIAFWGLGGRSLWGSEGRWAEITPGMFLTKDFSHPTIGGQPYFEKPLLTYWLIVGVAKIFGTFNEWALRISSALAGVAAVWATVSIDKRLWLAQVRRIAEMGS